LLIHCLFVAVYTGLNELFRFLSAMHLNIALNSTAFFFIFLVCVYKFKFIQGMFSCEFSARRADICMQAKGSNTHICIPKHGIKIQYVS
jgi:hypothetical protein